MAMEPISGIVAFQSQNYQNTATETKPITSSGKTADEFVEVPKDGAQPVDRTTVTVISADNVEIYKDGGSSPQQQGADAQGKKQKVSAPQQYDEFLDREQERIREVVEELNRKMVNAEAQFGFHEATNRYTIKIINKDTKEVIKEIPSEKSLDWIAKVWEMEGIMVDHKG